jgi:TPR repeat protein
MLRKLRYLFFALLLATVTLHAIDARLNNNQTAIEWEKDALAGDADAMYNLARTYQTELKDYDKAIYWYEKAYDKEPSNDIANNLGYLYDDLGQYDKAIQYYKWATENGHALSALNLGILCKNRLQDYDKAIEWYKKAYNMGNMGGANGLGYLYKNIKNDLKKAEEWYNNAIKGGNTEALQNMAHLYYQQDDTIKGAAYFIATIDVRHSKSKVINYLKTKWHLTKDQIKQAYELQKTLDIPKHYTGGID